MKCSNVQRRFVWVLVVRVDWEYFTNDTRSTIIPKITEVE